MKLAPSQPTEHPASKSMPQMIADRRGTGVSREPLAQGRHRGQQVGMMRDATDDELDEARKITQDLIEGFLRSMK
jgi:hypothetical protein